MPPLTPSPKRRHARPSAPGPRRRATLRATLLALLLASATLGGCLAFHEGPMPGEPANATYVHLLGTRVRYTDSGGAGTPVVMLHGFASALEVWTGIDAQLAADGHRVIALDLKGFGWTDRPEGDYSPDAQADLVIALMDALGVERAALVAHSWGSSVALALTLAHPERVERLALYDAWVYEEQLPTGFIWARVPALGELVYGWTYKERPDDKIEAAFYDPSLVSQALIDDVEMALDRPGTVAAALAAVRGQRYAEVQARYATVAQPVLLLWGAEDIVARPEVAYRLHRQLPRADLVMYPECGHFPMIEARHASTRALRDFLGQPWPTADDAAPTTPGTGAAPAAPHTAPPADAAEVQP